MNQPEISVVMATRDAEAFVGSCLESLAAQEGAPEFELIVADGSRDSTAEQVRAAFPQVRHLQCNQGASLPQLLLEGLRAARGQIVVITEPFCRFPADWLRKLREAHASEFTVVGGAVRLAGQSAVDRASYLADYGGFLPEALKRETSVLAGNHVSYKYAVLARAVTGELDGFRKTFFHWELERQGVRFLFEPALLVDWERRQTFGECVRRFFDNGRDFAGERSKSISPAERVLRMLTAPLLPPVVLYRRLRPIAAVPGYRVQMLVSLPLIMAFVMAWAAGEFLGYWSGPIRVPQRQVRRA